MKGRMGAGILVVEAGSDQERFGIRAGTLWGSGRIKPWAGPQRRGNVPWMQDRANAAGGDRNS
jgi:hypothetical protein